MVILFWLSLLVYVLVCVVLVTLILMQEGKGGGLSGVMGSSMGETFGFGGASKQIRKYTGLCATIFLVLTVALTFVAEAAFRNVGSDFIGTDATPAAVAPAPTTVTPAAGEATAPAPNGATPGQVTPAEAPASTEATPAL